MPIKDLVEIKKISTREEFTEFIREGVRLVYFRADWCPPCRSLDPTIGKVASQVRDSIKAAWIEVGDLQSVASQEKIQSIPYVILYKDGKRVDWLDGRKNEDQYLLMTYPYTQ